MKKFLYISLFCMGFMMSFSVMAIAAPLLSPGKKSVYQRVVTHPGAKLYATADANAAVLRSPVKTFTVMYIYDRQGDRLQVGAGADKPDGWMDKDEITEWPQAITMVFTDRTGRDPVLFFNNHQALVDICLKDDIGKELSRLYQNVRQNGQLPANYPVIASEPQDSAVSEKNFYLLPVLSIDDQFYENQGPRLIEVASINPGIGTQDAASADMMENPGKESDYKTGFAFVIDTTISMKPYIDQTLELIRHLYDELEKSPNADKVAFAVIAFRNDTGKTPGLEYRAKVISGFTTARDRKKLENALAKVKEANVSSHDVNEDSFAGVKEAVDNLAWDEFGGRILMMVTDAGPLGAGDPASATGFSPEALADYLRAHRIYPTTVHIKNPKSAFNHSYAEKAYREFTMQSDNQSSYLPIDARDQQKALRDFNNAANILASHYVSIAEKTARGERIQKPKIQIARRLSPEEEAKRIAESTGYAMQLQFFGTQNKAVAPQIVNAWIADADLEKLANSQGAAPILAVEPAVLLTKGQLSNLYKQLKILLEGSETAFLNGDADLFAQISSAAAQLSRDPEQYSLHPDRNLLENGLLDEVLADLPYKSVIGSMSRRDWENMSTGERDAFIRRIKSLLARYEAYDRDASHWESFGASNPSDWVYRVPLSMLP